MEYMTREELVRLFRVAREHNPLHHVAMLVGLLHGLRVSETLAIRGRDICDGKLSVKRLKKSRATLHALRIDGDVCSMSRHSSNFPGRTLTPSCSPGPASTWMSSSSDIRPSPAFTLQSGTTMRSEEHSL